MTFDAPSVLPIAYFHIVFFGLCQPVKTLVAGEYCRLGFVVKIPVEKNGQVVTSKYNGRL
jgi:hypothetical protein